MKRRKTCVGDMLKVEILNQDNLSTPRPLSNGKFDKLLIIFLKVYKMCAAILAEISY
jgi:hypothetical protein